MWRAVLNAGTASGQDLSRAPCPPQNVRSERRENRIEKVGDQDETTATLIKRSSEMVGSSHQRPTDSYMGLPLTETLIFLPYVGLGDVTKKTLQTKQP